MAWPRGVPCPDHVREKISQALIARCNRPEVAAAWKRTDAAQKFWYANVNQHSGEWPHKET